MNVNTPTEIFEIHPASTMSPGLTYEPVWISTDRRISDPTKTTLKYAQVGGPTAADKIGNAHGPIFRIEVLSATASYIKIWGLDNDDINAPIYPISRFTASGANPILDIWLKKFEFTDVSGDPVSAGTYKVLGHRSRHYPSTF
jgi:hypothetical protein